MACVIITFYNFIQVFYVSIGTSMSQHFVDGSLQRSLTAFYIASLGRWVLSSKKIYTFLFHKTLKPFIVPFVVFIRLQEEILLTDVNNTVASVTSLDP